MYRYVFINTSLWDNDRMPHTGVTYEYVTYSEVRTTAIDNVNFHFYVDKFLYLLIIVNNNRVCSWSQF